MICVSIGRGRHKHMLAEHRHLVDQGAKLVELRLDYIDRQVNLKRLIGDRPCPVVVTIRRVKDGGKWDGNEQARQILLRSAIAEGVDYVDLEMDIAGSIPRFGKTQRIVSYHNFQETPDNLEQLHEQMCQMDPDIVKLATMAHHPQDNLRMLRLIQTSAVPTVGLCMGDIGTPSRILCGKFGAPFTYATFHHERRLAPGQLSYRQMKDIYNYDAIGPKTELFGVIADPVGHSLSPLIHNAAFQHLGMDRVYLPFRVPREDLDSFLGQCAELKIKGLSVTIPHKEQVVQRLSHATDNVRMIGAANTVIFKDGQAHGYNTDCNAALKSVLRAIGESKMENPLQDRVVLVLGAGGVARAVACGLHSRSAEVVLTNRNPARAQALAEEIGVRHVPWAECGTVKAAVVVNCTPVGMHPNVDESPFPKSFLNRGMVIFDTVYNPEQTLFIKQARDVGCRTVSGVDMFVQQAAMQFRYFTGQEAPLEVMTETLRRAIGAARF